MARYRKVRGLLFVSAAIVSSSVIPGMQAQADTADSAAAQKYEAEADRLLTRADNDGALIALKIARKADPGNARIRLSLAEVELRLNDLDSARAELQAARQEGGDEAKIIPLLGRIYLNQGKFDDLLNDFPVREDASAEIRAKTLVVRANAQIGLGAIDDARTSLLAAEKLEPQSSAPKFVMARLDFTHSQVDRALSEVDDIIKTDPSGEAHFLKAEILVSKGDTAGALAEFDEAIKEDPNHFGARVERAQLLIAQGKDAPASADIKAALTLAPRSVTANYFQAMLLTRAKDFAAADAILTKQASSFPGFPQGYYLQAVVKSALKQYEQAESAIDSYNTALPNDPKGLKLKVDLLLRKQDYAGATAILEDLTAQNPNDVDALVLLGRAFMPSNVYESVEAYRKAAQLAPDNVDAKRGLALDYMAENHNEASAAELEKAIQMSPDDERGAESLALVEIQQKHYAQADALIADMIKKQPNDPGPLYLSGLVQRDQLHEQAAKDIFGDVEKKFPDFIPARLQLAALSQADGDGNAADMYQAILDKDPANVAALQALSTILMTQKKPDAVVDLWKKSHRAAADSVPIDIGLIHAYIANNDIEGGLSAIRDMQVHSPREPKLFEMRAELEVRKHSYNDAVISLKAMNDLLPRNAVALRDLAVTQEKAGDIPGALQTIAAARKLDPANAVMANDEVRLMGLSNPDKGVAAARKFAALVPDDPTAQAMAGDYLLAQKRPADAAAAYREAFAAHPSLLLAERLAQSAVRDGKPAAGEKTLADFAAAHADDPDAHFSLGSFLMFENKFPDAKTQFETVLKSQPENPAALNNLALICQHDGDSCALDYARKAVVAAPDNPRVEDTLGWIMARKDDAAGGVKLLRRAHDLAPQDLDTQYHLAYALNQTGKKEDATALLKSALATGTDFDARADAQTLLDQLTKS